MRLNGNPLLKTLRRPAENKKTGKFRWQYQDALTGGASTLKNSSKTKDSSLKFLINVKLLKKQMNNERIDNLIQWISNDYNYLVSYDEQNPKQSYLRLMAKYNQIVARTLTTLSIIKKQPINQKVFEKKQEPVQKKVSFIKEGSKSTTREWRLYRDKQIIEAFNKEPYKFEDFGFLRKFSAELGTTTPMVIKIISDYIKSLNGKQLD